jgi:hypothetical protein
MSPRRIRLPPRARIQLPARAPTISTSRPRKSASSTCAPATLSPARYVPPRTASATSRSSKSKAVNFEDPRSRPQQDLLRQPDPALSAGPPQDGNRQGKHDRPRARTCSAPSAKASAV